MVITQSGLTILQQHQTPLRGLFAGGDGPSDSANNVIDFITIATTGNAVDFGDLASRRTRFVGATASPTRGFFAGGKFSLNR